jgi:hypothetical protein
MSGNFCRAFASCIFLIVGISPLAHAVEKHIPVNLMLPTLPEVSEMKPELRAKYIKAFREFLVNTELHSGIVLAYGQPIPKSPFWQNLFSSVSFGKGAGPTGKTAQEDEVAKSKKFLITDPDKRDNLPTSWAGQSVTDENLCMYGGNTANYDGTVCHLDAKNQCSMNGQADGGVTCNPLLFGLKNDAPICVDKLPLPNHATRKCELAANPKGEPIDISKDWEKILQNANLHDLDSWKNYLDFTYNYCDNPKGMNNKKYEPLLKGRGEKALQTDCQILRKNISEIYPQLKKLRQPQAAAPAPVSAVPTPPEAKKINILCKGQYDGKDIAIGGIKDPEQSGLASFPNPVIYNSDGVTPNADFKYLGAGQNKECIPERTNCGYKFEKNGKEIFFNSQKSERLTAELECVDRTEKTVDVCTTKLDVPNTDQDTPKQDLKVTLQATLNGVGGVKEPSVIVRNQKGEIETQSGYFVQNETYLNDGTHPSDCKSISGCHFRIANFKNDKLFYDVEQSSDGKNCNVKKFENRDVVEEEEKACNGAEDGYEIFCAVHDNDPNTNGGKPFKKVSVYRYQKGAGYVADAVVCDADSEQGPFRISNHRGDFYVNNRREGTRFDYADAINDHTAGHPIPVNKRHRDPLVRDTDGNGIGDLVPPQFSKVKYRIPLLNFGKETIRVANTCGYKIEITRHNEKIGGEKYKNICQFKFEDAEGNKTQPDPERQHPFYKGDFFPGRTNWGNRGAK